MGGQGLGAEHGRPVQASSAQAPLPSLPCLVLQAAPHRTNLQKGKHGEDPTCPRKRPAPRGEVLACGQARASAEPPCRPRCSCRSSTPAWGSRQPTQERGGVELPGSPGSAVWVPLHCERRGAHDSHGDGLLTALPGGPAEEVDLPSIRPQNWHPLPLNLSFFVSLFVPRNPAGSCRPSSAPSVCPLGSLGPLHLSLRGTALLKGSPPTH